MQPSPGPTRLLNFFTRLLQSKICGGLLLAVCLYCPRGHAESLEQLWELALGFDIVSAPALAADGTIYTTLCGNNGYWDISGGKLAAVSPQGAELWTFPTFCDIKSSPAIGGDGTIYFGCRDRKFYAVNPNGKLKWAFTTGAWVDASAAIGANGVVYFGGWDQNFYALNPDGGKRWEFKTGGPIDSSAAIGADGTIYFGSHDKKLYALTPEGKVKWSFLTLGAIVSSPALTAKGEICFTSSDGKLYVLNPDGSKKLAVCTGGVGESSPVLDADGNIYLGINDLFVAMNPDGTKRWDFGHPVAESTAAVAADGTVYFVGLNEGVGVLYAFNQAGALKSYTSLGGQAKGCPTIGKDGTVYLGSFRLRAFKGAAGLAKSSWPKFRGNLTQTGQPAE